MNKPQISFNYHNSPEKNTSDKNTVNQLSHITFIENEETQRQKVERKSRIFEKINMEKAQSNKSPQRRNRTVTIFGNISSDISRSLSKTKQKLEQKPQKTNEHSIIKIDLPPPDVKIAKGMPNSKQLDQNLQDRQTQLRLLKMEVQRYKRIEKISHQNQQLSRQLNSKLTHLLQHSSIYVKQSHQKNDQQQQRYLQNRKKERSYFGKQIIESKKNQMQIVVADKIISLNNSRRSIKDLVEHNIELANASRVPKKNFPIDTSNKLKFKETIERKYPQANHIFSAKYLDKRSQESTAERELHQINKILELSCQRQHSKRRELVQKNVNKERSSSIRTKRSYIHIYE